MADIGTQTAPRGVDTLTTHLSMIDFIEFPQEDLVASMLGAMGYAAQTLRLHPDKSEAMSRYLSSEKARIREKISLGFS